MAAYSVRAEHMRSTLFSFLLDAADNETSNSDILLPSVLNISDELKLFADEKANVQNWIGHINQCLGVSKTRLQGLRLFSVLLSQCSGQVLSQNWASWVQLLMQILQAHESPSTMHLTSSALATLLQGVSNMAEVSRELSTNHLPDIISTTLALKPQLQQCAVQVLDACLRYFSGPCGPYRSRIENYLVSTMQSSLPHITLAVCKCYALLPRAGGGGTGGGKHTEAWGQCCDTLLHTAHSVLEQLYQDVELGMYSIIPSDTIALVSPPDREPARTNCLVQQFEAVCLCLQNLLEEEFPSVVKIPLENIISLCCRTLAVTGQMVVHSVLKEMTMLGASIPSLHTAAFNVLAALITSCRSNLIPQGQVINKLFIQTLAWTQTDHTGSGKQLPYSTLRNKTYQCLQLWLEILGASSGLEAVAETLLEQLLLDARPQVDITKLATDIDDRSTNKAYDKKGKKTKPKGQMSAGQSPSMLQRNNVYANSDVCLAALKVLRLMFLRMGMTLKPMIHKEVHEFTVSLLLQIQQSRDRPPIPYGGSAYREALYALLLACVLVPNVNWPAPLHSAVRLFSVGRQEASIQVASTCAEASVICANLIHPKVPSLHSPMNIAQIEMKPKKVLQAVSDELSNVAETPTTSNDMEDGVSQSRQLDMGENDVALTLRNGAVKDSLRTDKEEDTVRNDQQMDQDEKSDLEEDGKSEAGDESGADVKREEDKHSIQLEDNNDLSENRKDTSLLSISDGGGLSSQMDEVTGVDRGGCAEGSSPAGSQGGLETKSGKRKRVDDEAGPSKSVKKKVPTMEEEEEETTEEISSMLSTFVESYPDLDNSP